MRYDSEFFEFLPCLFLGYERTPGAAGQYPAFADPSLDCLVVDEYVCDGECHNRKHLAGLFFPLFTCSDPSIITALHTLAKLVTWPDHSVHPFCISELHEIATRMAEIGPLNLERHEHYSKCREAFVTFDPVPALPWITVNLQRAEEVRAGEVKTSRFSPSGPQELIDALGHHPLPEYWDSVCVAEHVSEAVTAAFLWVNQYPSNGFRGLADIR